MRRHIAIASILISVATVPLAAATFDRASIAPQLGVDVLSRTVARQQVGRDLFASPYATVTIGNVDVYDVFPYVEARHFQVVSDPRWNRLVYGEAGASLRAYDGAGTPLGALNEPRGLAVDEHNRVYVADTGNNRIVVLQARTEFETIELQPLYGIPGLGNPHGVAYSDGGTPFEAGDDILYVADTGKNRIVVFALEAAGAREVASLGTLGSAAGCFAGPIAIAVGRTDGVNTHEVYVADAHNHRIVHLHHDQDGLTWVASQRHEANVLTSLDTDHWGNLYACAPNDGAVCKFTPALVPVAELREQGSRPRSFHVPFFNVHDHRSGSVARLGQPNGVMIEEWSKDSGIKLWRLGVEVRDLAMAGGDAPAAHFILTDRAELTLEIESVATGRVLARRALGRREAGAHAEAIGPDDLAGASGDLTLRIVAASGYANGPSHVASTPFHAAAGGVTATHRPVLLGNTPNPFMPATRIAFVLPSGAASGAALRVFDAMGRRVRSFDGGFEVGMNEVIWDGSDDHGKAVTAGVYFYRLAASGIELTRKMVLVR